MAKDRETASTAGDWLDVDLSNDYPPGTVFEMPGGELIDMNSLPELLTAEQAKPPPRAS
jgi:hypothetical protein